MMKLGDWTLINNLEELKNVDRAAGYRGHEDSRLDALNGDDDPTEYPVLARTVEAGEYANSRTHYYRMIVTVDHAWALLVGQAERKVGAAR